MSSNRVSSLAGVGVSLHCSAVPPSSATTDREAAPPTMTDAFARLRAALAGRYALERELGAGGMATVDEDRGVLVVRTSLPGS